MPSMHRYWRAKPSRLKPVFSKSRTEATLAGIQAPDIGEGEASYQHVVAFAEDEKCISEIAALVFGIAPDPAAKSCAGEIVSRPGRLPRREELAAIFAQPDPCRTVRHLRRPQQHAIAGNRGRQVRQRDTAEECHIQ